MSVADLPAVNAILNATAALFLGAGFWYIRRRRREAHRACMVAAFLISAVFLASYTVYHAMAGSVPFTGRGWIRPFYFLVLVTHIVLAAAILPLSLITLCRALRGRFERHRAVARWTLPIWLYVSITGVVIYLMLYRF